MTTLEKLVALTYGEAVARCPAMYSSQKVAARAVVEALHPGVSLQMASRSSDRVCMTEGVYNRPKLLSAKASGKPPGPKNAGSIASWLVLYTRRSSLPRSKSSKSVRGLALPK